MEKEKTVKIATVLARVCGGGVGGVIWWSRGEEEGQGGREVI